MSKNKLINSSEILENKVDLIDYIRSEVLYRSALFFINRRITFHNNILEFIRNPLQYPGQKKNIKLIVKKFLEDIISECYKEIQEEELQIKFVFQSIMNNLFNKRGGRH